MSEDTEGNFFGVNDLNQYRSEVQLHQHLEGSIDKRTETSKEWSVPKRVITTLPSATEIVSLLGLEDRLVGITHECDYPPSVRNKQVVMRSVFDSKNMSSKEIDASVIEYISKGSSIYTIDEDLLQKLNPDLIITQELCEVCATPLQLVAKSIARLDPKPRILSLSPHNLEEVLQNVIEVGAATGKLDRARIVVSALQKRIDLVKKTCLENSKLVKPSVFCLEWLDPIYCSGHWMPELVKFAGGVEVLGRFGEPSTVTSWERVVEADPEVIFITVCGYRVERTLSEMSVMTEKPEWKHLQAVRKGKVYVLDSPSYYSRSGPRLVDGLEIMAFLLHPDLFPSYTMPRLAAYSLSQNEYL